jgi:multiple sugar transport system permease protein
VNAGPRPRFLPKPSVLRENLAGFAFISPAFLIITVFGLFPIGYAIYMSMHRWRIRQGDFLGLDNFTRVVGDWGGALLFGVGFFVLFWAYTLWREAFRNERTSEFWRSLIRVPGGLFGKLMLGIGAAIVVLGLIVRLSGYEDPTGIGTNGSLLTGVLLIAAGVAAQFGLHALYDRLFSARDDAPWWAKVLTAALVLGIGAYMISIGWALMMGAGDDDFLIGLTYTFWFSFSAVPIQLVLALLLAYVLFQSIKGRQWYRMVFFLPYVAPEVAMAVVFNVIFSPRETGLANQVLRLFGAEPQRWVTEPDYLINVIFGTNFDGFLAGPSMALFTVVLLGVWKYVGYNAVIFLAGLGSVPKDLYEAAKVDGANQWHLFRYITLPLISPVTFYLFILSLIGTFQAFNSIYVMRDPFAQGTTDVASIVIFDTFYKSSQFGIAAAQSILLFLVILGLTGVMRNVFEKQVFYG